MKMERTHVGCCSRALPISLERLDQSGAVIAGQGRPAFNPNTRDAAFIRRPRGSARWSGISVRVKGCSVSSQNPGLARLSGGSVHLVDSNLTDFIVFLEPGQWRFNEEEQEPPSSAGPPQPSRPEFVPRDCPWALSRIFFRSRNFFAVASTHSARVQG
jgi:hypothetical protein